MIGTILAIFTSEKTAIEYLNKLSYKDKCTLREYLVDGS